MAKTKRHKVFISYHHEQDQKYKERFLRLFSDHIVDKSVDTGDIIDSNLPLDEIRRRIRDDYIAESAVTIVLIGPCTWKRKHVDWEIAASLSDTDKSDRCGLLGILLPNHRSFQKRERNPRLMPPRLAENIEGNNPFARIHDWTRNAETVSGWIHTAFLRRRKEPPPKNNYPQFADNRSGKCSSGWQS